MTVVYCDIMALGKCRTHDTYDCALGHWLQDERTEMKRPSWDETWLNVARVMALRAPCSRGRVGAVIVDSTNRIVATGYNGPPATFPRPWEYDCDGREGGGKCARALYGPTELTASSYTDCPTIHAEANAISFCDRRDREGGTIYCTSVFCWSCGKILANSGLVRVVVLNDAALYQHRGWDDVKEFLEASGLQVDVIDA